MWKYVSLLILVDYWEKIRWKKFRSIESDTATSGALRFHLNNSKPVVRPWHNVSSSINSIIRSRISFRRSNLVKIIPEQSATRNAMFKVIRSHNEIRHISAWIARLRSSLVYSFITLQAIRCKCLRFKVRGQGHRVKGQGHYVKWCVSSKSAVIRQRIRSATSSLAWRRN